MWKLVIYLAYAVSGQPASEQSFTYIHPIGTALECEQVYTENYEDLLAWQVEDHPDAEVTIARHTCEEAAPPNGSGPVTNDRPPDTPTRRKLLQHLPVTPGDEYAAMQAILAKH